LRVIVLHNPTAGDAELGPEAIVSALAAAGHGARWRSLKEDGWQEVLAEPADLVAVAGGDGSVRKVFLALVGSQLPVALLPVGSANNIARSLDLEEDDPASLIRRWSEHRLRPFDIGTFSAEGEPRFVEAAGGGLFAEVLARAKEDSANPSGGSKVEHGLRLLLGAVTRLEPHSWRIAVDGRELSRELLGVEATNVRETGPNVPLAPGADPGDGLLEVVLIGPEHRQAVADYLEARLAGGEAAAPGFDVRRGRRIELQPPAGARLHMDDELVPSTPPLAVATPQARLQVLVP
jgi:diacylglycerol kinase family enzyme